METFLFNSNATHSQFTNIVHMPFEVLDLNFVTHPPKNMPNIRLP